MITGGTRVFALLGDPVGHSLSPLMQNAAFRVLGLPAVYVALRCAAEDVPATIRILTRAGGGGNVTVPHKEVALRAVDGCSPLAAAVGACNTFWAAGDAGADGVMSKVPGGVERSGAPAAGDRVAGDNTDVVGVLAALDRLGAPEGPWLVAGTGGGARAAVIAARERGAAVAVVSRNPERREAFEQWVVSTGAELAPAEACRVLINATPLGLRPDDPRPIPCDIAPQAEVALDMVYTRGETRWVREMRAQGLHAADGRVMLVAQGAAALERWFPGQHAPVEVMRAVVDGALR